MTLHIEYPPQPPLPEVSMTIATLTAKADERFAVTPRSDWFTEMNSQLADFKTSGYRCLDILRIGEDNPTEAQIEEADKLAFEERDVAVSAAIHELGGAMRRHAKVVVEECPMDSAAYVEQVMESATRDHLTDAKAGRRVKPEVYGRFGSVIRDGFRLTFERRNDPTLGEYGLYANSARRVATRQDTDTWHGLLICWSRTLRAGMADVVEDMHIRDDARIEVLEALFGKYVSYIDVEPSTAASQLEGGCDTASLACARLTYAMNQHLIERGVANPKERAVIIARSSGPIGKLASLTLKQHKAFSSMFLGADPKNSVVTDPTRIRTDMLESGKNGRLNFTQPIENILLPNGGKIDRMVGAIRRIGCPILLTPRLIQGLWGSFVESAVQAELI